MSTKKLQIVTPIVTSVNGQTGDVTVATKTSELTNDSGFATTTYVDTSVAGLVDSAPETLDTLNELSAALGNDPNFATTVANQIGTKVDKVNGKGLSTNDYTTAEKNKLSGIATGANKTTVDSALSSTSTNPVQNKVINTALAGKANSSHTHAYLPTAGGTMTGALTTKGIKLTSGTDYGTTLPSSPATNQLFFQTVGSNFILDNVYPVGSIYMSVNSTNPGTLFGGTWERIMERFLFGCGDERYPAGHSGGEEQHLLTVEEMPSHNHSLAYGPNSSASITGFPYGITLDSATNSADGRGFEENLGTFSSGSGWAHNNMPPYLCVYIWKRTA